jgi:hypothetical protein
MRRTRGWTGLRTLAVALALGVASASAVQAAPIISYSTSGAVGLTGIDGPNVISFNSVATGEYDAPSSLSLGEFLVAPLAPGVSVTYDHTPFSITYLTNSVDGAAPTPNESPITINGFLSGTVTGAGRSDVVATFNPLETSTFQTGGYINSLRILDAAVSLVPSSTNGGRTTAQGRNIVQAVPPAPNTPEPATIVVFLTAAAGVGLRRRGRAGKAA